MSRRPSFPDLLIRAFGKAHPARITGRTGMCRDFARPVRQVFGGPAGVVSAQASTGEAVSPP